jgi:aminopeptidase N
MVLHSLRYLFTVRDGSDNVFWLLVQDFVQQHAHGRVSTREFLELAEARYGESLDWFWDQWLYGTDLPVVRWSKELSRTEDGGWLLTVDAEQQDTEMTLYIPVYVETNDGETLREPLIMRGKTGRATIELEDEPYRVSLNDDFEAIVRLED